MIRPKKSILVSENQPGEDFLSSTHPHKSNVYVMNTSGNKSVYDARTFVAEQYSS